MHISKMTQFLTKTVSRKTVTTIFSQTKPLEAEFQLSLQLKILDLNETKNCHEEKIFEIQT